MKIFPPKTEYSKKCICQVEKERKPTSEETDSTCAKWGFFSQKIETDVLSFSPFPPPVVSKDVQRNGTIVKSKSHLHVSDSCSSEQETT